MPIILIIVGIAVALGLGGFVFLAKPQDAQVEIVTPVARIEDSTASDTPSMNTPVAEPAQAVPTSTESSPKPSTNPAAVTPKPVTPAPVTPKPTPVPPVVTTPKTAYKDGTYTVTTSYLAPGRSTHNVTATLKIVNDTITESRVNYSGDDVETSAQYQSKFTQAYQTQVIGKKLDTITLSRVGGASLTTGAFNKAIAEVKASARS